MKVGSANLLRWPVFFLASLSPLQAQFAPAFLQNDSYWGDGKAEVDFYDAQVMRDGQPRHCELQIILAKGTLSIPKDPPDPSQKPPPIVPVIRMSQSMTIPRGLVNEQRASVLCFVLEGRLLAADSTITQPGDILWSHVFLRPDAKEITVETTSPREAMTFPLEEQTPTILRNELPLRVRMLDLSKQSGEFECRLIDAEPPGETRIIGRSTCKVSFKTQPRTIEVELREEKVTNKFSVDRDFPFLLREWKAGDGSTYKLKNSLRADYQKYLKEGDREKALKDPMLRHPD